MFIVNRAFQLIDNKKTGKIILPVFFCFIYIAFYLLKKLGGTSDGIAGNGDRKEKSLFAPPFPAIPSLVPHLKAFFYLFTLLPFYL